MIETMKYISDDGTECANKEEALARDKLHELGEWYTENKLYGMTEGCRIEWGDFVEWLLENNGKAGAILRACDQLLRAGG